MKNIRIKYIRQVRHMVNIYETEGGKLNALQDFEEGCNHVGDGACREEVQY